MLFIGPTLLAGIGQVTNRYAILMGGEYVEFGKTPSKDSYDVGFAFVLPIPQQLDMIDSMMARCKKKMYMTICETESVHPLYGELVKRYKTLYTPSVYCQNVFQRQFPEGEWKVLPLWQKKYDGPVRNFISRPKNVYTFYTIGNVIDPRKNIRMLLEAFLRLNMPNTRLIIKATCHTRVDWKFPRVTIINGLLPDAELEDVHDSSHCYINCSHSEGVGMGAVEAALRDKPVIITSYGGLKEYVKTPFIVNADKLVPVGINDFLFTSDLIWGLPDFKDLLKYMRTCAEQNITTWDHSFTKERMGEVGPLFSAECSIQY